MASLLRKKKLCLVLLKHLELIDMVTIEIHFCEQYCFFEFFEFIKKNRKKDFDRSAILQCYFKGLMPKVFLVREQRSRWFTVTRKNMNLAVY